MAGFGAGIPVLRRAIASAGAAFVALACWSGPARAAERPTIVVEEGRTEEHTFPAHTLNGPPGGPRPDDGYFPHPESDNCGEHETCTEVEVLLRLPRDRDGRDVLLTVDVSWDPAGGTWMGADVFVPADSKRGWRRIKQGTQPPPTPGRTQVVVVNPPGDRLMLLGWTVRGESRPWKATPTLTVQDRVPIDPSSPTASPGSSAGARSETAPSGRHGANTTTAVSPATPDRSATIDLPVAARLSQLRGTPPSPPDQRTLQSLLLPIVAATVLLGTTTTAVMRRRRSLASLVRLADVPLSVKLVVPFAVLITIVGGVGTVVTGRYLATQAADELDQSLVRAAASADAFVRDQEFLLLDAARYGANVEGAAQAVASGDAAATVAALTSVAAVHKSVDVIAAVGAGGTSVGELVRTGGAVSPHAGSDWTEVDAVQRALAGIADESGDKHSGFARAGGGEPLLLVAAPLRSAAPAGAVVVGVDAGKLARGASERAGAGVVVFDGAGSVLATSGSSLRSLPATDTTEARRESVEVQGADLAVRYQPLTLRGERLGTLAVSAPAGNTLSGARGAALRLSLLFVAGMAGAIALAIVLKRSVLQSVDPLLAANRALGGGDLAVRAPVRGADELGELAVGFNQMADQLQESVTDLERKVEERTEQLQRLYTETADAAEVRRQFFAAVSHEFRTPLFAIKANAELLLDPELRPERPDDVAEYVATIDRAAERLISRVDELLALARAESTAAVGAPAPVDLTALVGELRPMLVALGRATDVAVVVDTPDGVVVPGDRDRLVEVVSNLVSNAVKYTPAGGKVVIELEQLGPVACLRVTDTGTGIPPDVGDQVFEPYYRVAGTAPAGAHGSTGLGLAVTKRIVDAHRGSIRHEPRPGGGTVFTVELPCP